MRKNIFLLLVLALAGTSLFGAGSKIYTKAQKNLDDDNYDAFILGRSFFKIPWVEAPSATTARDGLGPLFNANTCSTCHIRNGRGYGRYEDGQLDRSVIIKLHDTNPNKQDEKKLSKDGVIKDKSYGGQIQFSSIYGVPREADIDLKNIEYEVIYPDNRRVILQKPKVLFTHLGYGPMQKGTKYSLRFAQSLVGMGHIDAISSKEILAFEDVDDRDKDGISGRANFVYSPLSSKKELGKFNWKASNAGLIEQIATAFHDDMGIDNHLYSATTCTKKQKKCLKAPKPRDKLDIPPLRLEAVNFYVSSLRIPKQVIKQTKGEESFNAIGCSSCHVRAFGTKQGQYPYSDFLLHDMGEGLSDGRSEFRASGSEWRTQPLWGLKYAKKVLNKEPRYLHDGRARSLEEAILWHGGEALKSKLKFMKLSLKKRLELIEFLKEL